MGRPGLSRHRKFARLTRLLGSAALARGHLELIWEVAYENGDDLLGDSGDVELLAQWQGEAGVLAAALVEAGFVDLDANEYRIHDLYDHAPEYVRKRADREAARQEKGITLREIRAAAARARWDKSNSKRTANGQQTDASDFRLHGSNANGSKRRASGTPPAPAPAPAPEEEASASPPPPSKAKRRKAESKGTDSVEPLRLRLIAFIRSQGVTYIDTSTAAERTNLRRALRAGATEPSIEDAFRAAYSRGGWNPRISDVARVLTSAGERPAGRRTTPGPELLDLGGIDPDGRTIYGQGTP
jgi:hypothetical protein